MKEKVKITDQEREAHNKIAAMITITKMLNDSLTDDAKRTFAKKVKEDPEILSFLIARKVMPLEVAERFIAIIQELIDSVETLDTKRMD